MISAATIGAAGGNKRKPPKVVQEIAAEASKRADDPNGRPLPLASTWDAGTANWGLSDYPNYLPVQPPSDPGTRLDLAFQLDLIRAGHHWMVNIGMPQPALTAAEDPDPVKGSYWFDFAGYYAEWDTVALWGLPFTIAATQFESLLYLNSMPGFDAPIPWRDLAIPDNPNVYFKRTYSSDSSANIWHQGWDAFTTGTPTYSNTTTLTCTGDNTWWLPVGRAVRVNSTTYGYAYGVIASSTFSDPTTTITIDFDASYQMDNTFSELAVSKYSELRGFHIAGSADPDTASEHVIAQFVPSYSSGDPVEVVQKTGGSLKVRYYWKDLDGTVSLAEDDFSFGTDVWLQHAPTYTDVYGWNIRLYASNRAYVKQDKDGNRTFAGTVTSIDVYSIKNQTDPDGPTTPWTEAGEQWTTVPDNGWRDLCDRYPNPPRVVFLSNNEGIMLQVNDVEGSSAISERFIAQHGTGLTQDECSQILMEGYETRFNLLFDGMRTGFDTKTPAWANSSKMVGYNAVVVWTYARYGGWKYYAGNFYFPNNIDYQKNYWEGASPEYYLNGWETTKFDYLGYSPCSEFMNAKWQLDLVYATHPDFWYEMSTWDGFALIDDDLTNAYANKRYAYSTNAYNTWGGTHGDLTPERWKAIVQFGMWLTFPRVVREFRNTSNKLERTGEDYFYKWLESIDDIYDDPVKTRFWRLGTLVANTARPHPYNTNTATEYDAIDKWFALETDPTALAATPTRPAYTDELLVWALALVIGTTPNREWLVYAYSPKQDRTNVTITIPSYGNVVIDVPQAGVFHYVAEA